MRTLAGRPRTRPRRLRRGMRSRFATKDVVSRIVQALPRPAGAVRVHGPPPGGREPVRETMGLVIGDLVPAPRALEPRYLAALLAP